MLLLPAPRQPDELEQMMRQAARPTRREASHRCPELLVQGEPLEVHNRTGANMPCPHCRQVLLINEEGTDDGSNRQETQAGDRGSEADAQTADGVLARPGAEG
ncbi:MAG TPA: hypothetical protein VKT25_10075 [Ktedonobacteraceae bacterium]|nr:hypothetical protein [Ktedonobacteraceae bacterium]